MLVNKSAELKAELFLDSWYLIEDDSSVIAFKKNWCFRTISGTRKEWRSTGTRSSSPWISRAGKHKACQARGLLPLREATLVTLRDTILAANIEFKLCLAVEFFNLLLAVGFVQPFFSRCWVSSTFFWLVPWIGGVEGCVAFGLSRQPGAQIQKTTNPSHQGQDAMTMNEDT